MMVNTVKDGKEDTDEDDRYLLTLAMRRGQGWGGAGLQGDTSANLSCSFFFLHFEAKQSSGGIFNTFLDLGKAHRFLCSHPFGLMGNGE